MRKDFEQLDWNSAIEDDLRQIVRLSVREDLDRQQDWTTISLVASGAQGRAMVVAREPGAIAGLKAAPVIIDEMDAEIDFLARAKDGDRVTTGTVIAELSGAARDLLTCERPLLNVISRLSGIATHTSDYVARVQGTGARVYDTRKTTPGWRRLEKYAVHCGGGRNHRTGLFDAILIKDNHLAQATEVQLSPANAVRRVKEFIKSSQALGLSADMIIEVEIDGVDVLDDVLRAAPDIVLLDNMSPEQLRAAVARRNEIAPSVELESSGRVSLDTVRDIALTGVDRISSGSLTHAARWLDVGLDWTAAPNR